MDALLVGDTPVQRAIDAAPSAPALRFALVGTRPAEHLAPDTCDAMGADASDAVFE